MEGCVSFKEAAFSIFYCGKILYGYLWLYIDINGFISYNVVKFTNILPKNK